MTISRLVPVVGLVGVVLGLVLFPEPGPARDPDEAARVERVTAPTTDFSQAEPYELNPGGAATAFEPLNTSAFSHPSANMSFERQLDFSVGNGFFRKQWVSAPSSTVSSDGLGPLFNARGCQSCHLKDGRGRPPAPGEASVSMFLRLSVPPQTDADRQALASHRTSSIAEPSMAVNCRISRSRACWRRAR